MPTGSILPTDPEQFLAQLTASPSGGPNSTVEQDQWADRGAQEAIAHYLATGTMPTSQRNYPSGPIQAIGQAIGLVPKFGPPSQYTMDRATLEKNALGEQAKARKLAEIQSIGPMAEQFGGKFGQQVMQQVDPSLVGAFDPKQIGKGEIAQQATQQKFELGQQLNEIKQAAMEGNLEKAQMMMNLAQEKAGISEERAGIAGESANAAMQRVGIAQDEEHLRELQYENAPERALWNAQLKDYTDRWKTLQSQRTAIMSNPMKATDREAALAYIDQQLQEIQAGREATINEMRGGRSSGRGSRLPSTLGATSITGPKPGSPIKKGLFGD